MKGITLVMKIVAGLILIGLAWLFFTHDPATAGFFPPCPFRYLTGYLCPGCGSQRAIHELLHGRVGAAFQLNPFMVLSLPYMGGLMYLKRSSKDYPKVYRVLYSPTPLRILAGLIVFFWVGRNLIG